MKKTSKYIVIGGQYDYRTYGTAKTLTGAKRLATKNAEYWDNWQGWHYPDVYRVEDVEAAKTFFGDVYRPKDGAIPVAIRRWGSRWEVIA